MVKKNFDLAQYNEYTSSLLSSLNVDKEDVETLILLLVSKYRKISGESIQEMLEKLQEMNKRKYKLEKIFQKKNAQMKKKDRD